MKRTFGLRGESTAGAIVTAPNSVRATMRSDERMVKRGLGADCESGWLTAVVSGQESAIRHHESVIRGVICHRDASVEVWSFIPECSFGPRNHWSIILHQSCSDPS